MIAIIIMSDEFRVNTLDISDMQSIGLSIIGFVLVTLGGFGRLWAHYMLKDSRQKN
ncbi:MAG: hypothetical protein Ct9H90mP15_08070 [Candidatus Neomarinimicrobiota bacterium]|nr:MAG: hypothetical protein Ct9H90mP15_08070 [Candidatus Neomarinimicrobiota bacterium]